MLDINYLYNGPATHPSQIKYRQRMTEAVYHDKRNEARQALIWLAVAFSHLLIMVVSLAFVHDMTHEIAQEPGAAICLAVWLLGDIVYIACFPRLSSNIQYELDRLEGKKSS